MSLSMDPQPDEQEIDDHPLHARLCLSRHCRTARRSSCHGLLRSEGDSAAGNAASGDAAAAPPATDAPLAATASPYDGLPEAVRLTMDKPFMGDFDAMVKRRSIRVGVTFNRTHYFIDQGQERGLTYESLKLFENDLNEDLKTGNLKCTW